MQRLHSQPIQHRNLDSNSVTLFAKGGSVYVNVTQKNDGERIYRRDQSDSPLTLDKSGPVEIMFTRGEYLGSNQATNASAQALQARLK